MTTGNEKDDSRRQLPVKQSEAQKRLIEVEALLVESRRNEEMLKDENRMLTARIRELNRLKDLFIDHISHEFRTPLAIIKGSLDTLRAFPDLSPVERNEFMALAAIETETLSRMIEDVLDIARIEAGDLVLNKNLHDLSTVVDSSLKMLHNRLHSKGIDIVTTGVKKRYLSFIDLDRIVAVINNLINNAINYSPKGGTVRIKLSREDTGDKIQNIVEVIDSGEGISEDKIRTIFDDFYRTRTFLRAKDKDSYIQGIGIGIYLSKRIIAMHGGAISAKTTPGGGSTFSIFLPVAEQSEGVDDRED